MNKSFRIIYSADALDDLRDIYSYIAFNLLAKNTAKNLVSRIRSEISSLKSMPERYPLVEWEPWHSMGVRTLLVGNYIAYYYPDNENNTILIARVFYGGRDIENIIKEDQDY